MAIRTTDAAVRLIIETEADILTASFIETASALVDEICVPLGYDDTRLELIERWLSAHFYAMRDPRRIREQADEVVETFQYKIGLNLSTTHHGQQAMMLCTKGGLKNLNKTNYVLPQAFWVGTAE